MKRLVLIVVGFFMLAGCGVDWFPQTDPNAPGLVVVTATQPSAGVSDIIATVTKPDGTAVDDGTIVNFSKSGTTVGTLSATTAPTVGGDATVTLSSVDPGNFTVTATAGNASGNATVVFLATVTITAPAAVAVNTPVNIQATVNKPDGITPVINGTQVTFTALPAGATFTPATQGTSNGIATVSFLASANTYTITATVGAAVGTKTVIVQ